MRVKNKGTNHESGGGAESEERSRETQQEMRGKESERGRDTINGRDRCIPDEITHGGRHGAIYTNTNT
jgi:hypothetical protein